jgi:hypothetical protein
MTAYTITVKQLVADHELSKPDDRITNPSGEYQIEARSSEAALDEFHATVAIGCLDDFEVTVDPDDTELDYTMEELLTIDRCMHALKRVTDITVKKFGQDDGLTMLTRATYALLMEQFASHATVDEFKAIEARLTDEENIILKPLAI